MKKKKPPYWDIPIFINSCNRFEPLLAQVTWLLHAGYENLTIIDNASSYPPLLDYLELVRENIAVIGLSKNVGKFALWKSGAVDVPSTPYIYTDPDIVPDYDCPPDLVTVCMRALEKHPQKRKCGIGLKINDLPDHYAPKPMVVAWEQQFWEKPLDSDGLPCALYDAKVDTTLAVYLDPVYTLEAMRTGHPYVARHTTWYLNSKNPGPEQLHYDQTSRVSGTWKMNGSRSQAVNNKMAKLRREGKLHN